MNDDILKRDMFSRPVSKSTLNSGIMAGFEDDMDEEEDEQFVRSPQNPEILMNNLRGDVRSIDARYLELAQMVGEEAAMETPPEVLAMLQSQLSAQQAMPSMAAGGIGALPQAPEMAPPMMPPGMEGAPPFPPGGAEQAPPTPDGLPPMQAAVGGIVSGARRGISFLNELAGQYLPPSFRISPMRGPDGGPIGIQGRESIVQGPRGPEMGAGTRFTRGQTLEYSQPPFSQVLQEQLAASPTYNRLSQVAASYPKSTAAGVIGGGAGLAASLGGTPMTAQSGPSLADQIPGQALPPSPMVLPPAADATINQVMRGTTDLGIPTGFGAESRQPAVMDRLPATQPPKTTADFIQQQVKREAAAKTRGERIKEEFGTLEPTFRELLGDTKSEARTNALLLLAEAGFKFASTYKPTMAMALGEALSGVPRGFAAIAAQAKDRDIKIRTAALNQAVDNVNLQDKYARDFQLEELKGQYRAKVELLKGDYRLMEKQIESGSIVREDGGMGLETYKKKNGSLIDNVINPNSPTVKSAIDSRFTLRPTDNPFVEDRGAAPTTVETDKGERVKLGNTLRALDNSLQTLDNLKGEYTNLYSPGTWFTDKVNNLIVPVSAGMVRPDVNQEASAARIRTGLNTVMKSIASANDQGRVAVQEQEWARETLSGLSNPTAFFTNKEIAAKQFATMEAVLRNARQNVLTQLGYVDKDYVMATPATGTQNDPFVVPTDPDAQRRMFVFLGSTIGTIQNPKATVYLRMPNGRVDAFNPAQLKGLIK
jgi:hypothetical protein